jgi:hypothetical protein
MLRPHSAAVSSTKIPAAVRPPNGGEAITAIATLLGQEDLFGPAGERYFDGRRPH